MDRDSQWDLRTDEDQEPYIREPRWFSVIGGPPPADVLLRDLVLVVSVPLGLLVCSLWLPGVLRPVVVALALVLAVALSLGSRWRWRRSQGVRIVGSVLEYRKGAEVYRLALTRSVISAAASPPGVLVLIIDDGRSHLAVGRRAEPHELIDLPPRLGPYLELRPEDFEEIRIAAHRSYPRA